MINESCNEQRKEGAKKEAVYCGMGGVGHLGRETERTTIFLLSQGMRVSAYDGCCNFLCLRIINTFCGLKDASSISGGDYALPATWPLLSSIATYFMRVHIYCSLRLWLAVKPTKEILSLWLQSQKAT